MTWWHRLFRRGMLESHLDAELRDHLDRQTADFVASGLTEREARRQALRLFGGVEAIKEECRDARGTRWLHDAVADVRYSLRLCRKSPAFSAVAVLSLALGIGANVAVVSLVDAVLLKTLPVRSPGDLVLLAERSPERQVLSWSRTQLRELSASQMLTGLCAFRPQIDFSIAGAATAELVPGQLVSGNCFDVVGIRTAIGRTLTPEDEEAVRPVAVIGYGFWQRYFGRDPAVIGRTIHVKGRAFTVVGVTSRDFLGLEAGRTVDVTIPLSHATVMASSAMASPNVRWFRLIGRLRPGVQRDRAAADLERLWRQGERRNPQSRFEMLSGAQGLNDLRRQFSVPLRILMAAVGLLLLVACANLASLMLARARSRDHEIRLRLALGAGRGRIIRQLLTESCVLALIGGAAGLGLAAWASQAMVVLLSRGRTAIALPQMLDVRLLAFAFALTLVTSLAFGVWPALWATREGARSQAGKTRTSTAGGRRRAAALIAAQTTVSALLLTGAVLFTRSLSNLHAVDLGFDKSHVLLAGIRPGLAGYDRPRVQDLYRDLFVRLAAAPDVQSVTMTMDLPLGGVSYTAGVAVPPEAACDDQANFNFVGPRFFETMRIPIVAGRDLQLADDSQARPVGVISQSLAARCFPGRSAVGAHLQAGGQLVEIVGVAANVPYAGVREPRERMLYRPYLQAPAAAAGLTLALRTGLPAGAAADLVRGALHELDPAVPVSSLSTLDARVDGAIASERLLANISGFFGVMALLLVGIGVYGTLAYSIAQRTRELGVRLALGATHGDIARLVLRGALTPVCLGLAVGLPLTLAAGRVAGGLLYGITPREPTAYATSVAVLFSAALLAAAIPAQRAVSADPIAALREE
jgi:predicted permease